MCIIKEIKLRVIKGNLSVEQTRQPIINIMLYTHIPLSDTLLDPISERPLQKNKGAWWKSDVNHSRGSLDFKPLSYLANFLRVQSSRSWSCVPGPSGQNSRIQTTFKKIRGEQKDHLPATGKIKDKSSLQVNSRSICQSVFFRITAL